MSSGAKWFVIGALVVGLAGLAYVYYQDENTISIETGALDVPAITEVMAA